MKYLSWHETLGIFIFSLNLMFQLQLVACKESLCDKGSKNPDHPCCPTKHIGACCNVLGLKPCNTSLKLQRIPALTSGNIQYKPLCSSPLNTTSCQAGFYLDDQGNTQPCPEGYYCPALDTCILPCPRGAYCMPGKIYTVKRGYSSLCSRLGYCCRGSGDVPTLIESGKYACPGSKLPVTCPKGYFCPTADTKTICPKGSYCQSGSTEPKTCPALARCKQGESAPLQNAIGPLVTVFLQLLLILVYWLFEYRRDFREKVNIFWESYKGNSNYTIENGMRTVLIELYKLGHETKYEIAPKEFTIDLSFEDLTLTLNSNNKCVLQGVTGELRSGEVTAIMGPSGAGKTTLLNTVAGKAYYGKVGGILKANGEVISDLNKFKRLSGFVPQEDIMHRSLNVKEVLRYQGRLRLPPSVTSKEISKRVDDETRGISGGQRKRVNIGMELIADPTLLFLDEPTSGLDSTSSLSVLDALRTVAEKGGLTIACVLHQPRYEIFSMFHKILLLAPGGRTVYEGEVLPAKPYFESMGFYMDGNTNPADFYMDVISGAEQGDHSHPTDKLPDDWLQKLQQSSTKRDEVTTEDDVHVTCRCGTNMEDKMFLPRPNMFLQFLLFLAREFILQFRMMRTIFLDLFLVLMAGGVLGALYQEVSLRDFLTMSTMSSMALGLVAMIPSLRCFGLYRTIFWREAGAGVNRLSYFLAVNIAQLPHIFLMPIMYLSLQYTFTAPRGYLNNHYIVCLASWFAVSGSGYAISCAMNPKNAQMAAVLFILISALLSGSQPTLCKMAKLKVVGPAIYSSSYARWFVEAMFEKEVDRYPAVFTRLITTLSYRNDYDLKSFYTCVGVLFGYGLIMRVFAFLFLRLLNRGQQQ